MLLETLRDYTDYLNTLPSFFHGDISLLEFFKATVIYVGHAFKDWVIYIFTFAWLRDFIEIPLLLRHTYTCVDNLEMVSKASHDLLVKWADNGPAGPPTLGFFSAVDLEKFYSSHLGTGFFNGFFLCCPMTVSHFLTIRALLVNGVPAALSSGLGMIFGQMSFIICVLLGFENIIMPWVNMHEIVIVAGVLILIYAIKDLNEDPGWEKPIDICPPHAHLIQKLFRTTLSLSWFEQICIFSCLGNITTVGTSTVLETAGGNFWFGTGSYIVGLGAGFFLWGLVWGLVISRIRWFIIGATLPEVEFIHNACMSMALAFSLASFPYYGSEYFTGKVLGFLPGDPYMAWSHPQTDRFYHPISNIATGQVNTRLTSVAIPDYDLMLQELINERERDAKNPMTVEEERDKDREDEMKEMGFVAPYNSKCSPVPPDHMPIESVTCESERFYINSVHHRNPPEEQIRTDELVRYRKADHGYKKGLEFPPFHEDAEEAVSSILLEMKLLQKEIDLLEYRQQQKEEDDEPVPHFRKKKRDSPMILNPSADEDELIKASRDRENMKRFKEEHPNTPVPSIETRKQVFIKQLQILKDAYPGLGHPAKQSYAQHLKEFATPDTPSRYVSRFELYYTHKDLELGNKAECQFAFREKFYSNPVYNFLLKLDMFPFYLGQSREEAVDPDEEALLFAHRVAVQNYANSISFFKSNKGPGGFARQVSNQQFKGTLDVIRMFRFAQVHEAQPVGPLPPAQDFDQKPEKKSFFKSVFGIFRKKTKKNTEQLVNQQAEIKTEEAEQQNLDPGEPIKTKKKSFFKSVFGIFRKKTKINPGQPIDQQTEVQLEHQTLGNNEQIQPDQQIESQQAGTQIKQQNLDSTAGEQKTDQETTQIEKQNPNDQNPIWTYSKEGFKHKVLKYDQPLPQRIEDQENFAFHEELELDPVEPSKDPLTHFPMVDQSVPMYIGWDGNLRKFLVKTQVAPYQIYTSDQIHTDPNAIYNNADLESKDADLESEDADLESIEKLKSQNEILSYYSFQSWAQAAKRVKPRKNKNAIVQLPTAQYSKRERSDIKKILLGHILTEQHIENEKRTFKKDLTKIQREAEKKVDKIMKNLPDYDWWWRTSTDTGENLEIAIDLNKRARDLRRGQKKFQMSGKIDLGKMDAANVLHYTKLKPSDKININRNEKINYNKADQVKNIRKNYQRIYTDYFNLGSSAPPGVYGLVWPGVRDPGYFRYPLHRPLNRNATKHLLNETVEDLKQKNKKLNTIKKEENVLSYTPYTQQPVKRGVDFNKYK